MTLKPGTRIRVKPVVFYPLGVATQAAWHTAWTSLHHTAREKFRLMLEQRDTFELAPLEVVNGALTATAYKNSCFSAKGLQSPRELSKGEECSNGVETILAELLAKPFADGRRYTRYTLPYCLSVLMVDPGEQWGAGGGRTLNGEANLGGGILVIPTWHFDNGRLTSTLVHELGHTFGLVHTWDRVPEDDAIRRTPLFDCYYHGDKSRSVMSYRIANHTNATDPAQVPGFLLGDDIHALSGNKQVFPALFFDASKDFDCPPATAACPPHDGIVRQAYFGPMHMMWCTTGFESFIGAGTASRLNDTPDRWILSSHPSIGFVGERMWHSSAPNEKGWVSLDVTFPMEVRLNRILTFTEHSGQFHRAAEIQVERQAGASFTPVVHTATNGPDTEITFPSAEAQRWRLAFKAGPSGFVVVRGLRFFDGDDEWLPPLGPNATTDFGETHGSRVSNLVEIQRTIRPNTAAAGFDPRSMWHSAEVNDLGWVSIEVVFPTPVSLDRIRVHSQHSGQHHRATHVQLEVSDAAGAYSFVMATPLSGAHGDVTFTKTTGKAWKIAFKGEAFVVVRGLRFFIGNEEFYPPGKVE